jgi:hypothetical protein
MDRPLAVSNPAVMRQEIINLTRMQVREENGVGFTTVDTRSQNQWIMYFRSISRLY